MVAGQVARRARQEHGFKPRPKGKRPAREEEPGWLTTLYNQHVMAMDFKTVLDLSGNAMAVLNLIDHGRRVLHWSRATYHPTAEWVAQQLRNAFMDVDELPQAIVMDRDRIFLPLVKQTLPAMGYGPSASATGAHGRTRWWSAFTAHSTMNCCAMCNRSTSGTSTGC
jgi:hypothetical protein